MDLHDIIITRSGVHTHGSKAAEVAVERVKTSLKRWAEETLEQPSQIVINVIQNSDQATMGQMPNKDAARKLIQRVRNRNSMAPPAPKDLAELEILERYKLYKTTEGQDELFLLGDTGREDLNRILLFGRESYRTWTHLMSEVFMDGTFSLSPPLFEQVYAILCRRENYVFPVLYALLPNKQQSTHSAIFNLIKEIWPEFNPTYIFIDFEKAVINAAKEAFPNAGLKGCLFHLMKNFR